MEDRFKKFLEAHAAKAPIELRGDKHVWEVGEVGKEAGGPLKTSTLDLIYLDKPLEGATYLEKPAAEMLKEHIARLEERVRRLSKQNLVLKISLAILIFLAIALLAMRLMAV